MKPVNAFPGLLHAFFYERLVQQLNVSPHTVRSYRDTWRLFLRFAAERHKRPVAELTLTDLTATEVAAFLQHSEQARKVSIGTRNCRLAALRSFYGFVAEREPTAIAQCAAVRHIPTKKAPKPAAQYLEPNEIEAILAQPDRATLEGQRDHALLSFLYNTGARIQEALDVCPEAIRFESPMSVRLFGKGRKERICPLWPETVALLKALLRRQPRTATEPLFVNRYGGPLGASGARFKLAQYVRAAVRRTAGGAGLPVALHAPRGHLQQPAARDGRARRHLPLEGLPRQGQDAPQGDDAEPAGVHAPVPAACPARRLPPDPALRPAGQQQPARQPGAGARVVARDTATARRVGRRWVGLARPTFVCAHCGHAMVVLQVFLRDCSIRAPPAS
jgi:integrase/recombinase XerC